MYSLLLGASPLMYILLLRLSTTTEQEMNGLLS